MILRMALQSRDMPARQDAIPRKFAETHRRHAVPMATGGNVDDMRTPPDCVLLGQGSPRR